MSSTLSVRDVHQLLQNVLRVLDEDPRDALQAFHLRSHIAVMDAACRKRVVGRNVDDFQATIDQR